MRDDALKEAFAADVVLLKYVGLNPVIIHGGGPEISIYMKKKNISGIIHIILACSGSGGSAADAAA